MALPLIQQGDRAIIAGRTGSGKSALAQWFLLRSPGHWLILNPKHTKAYNKLPGVNIVTEMKASVIAESIEDNKYTVLNPPLEYASAEEMDNIIIWLQDKFTSVGLVVDELYMLHNNGRAGKGLLGWLTRGRELKQSFLGLTQRPAWLSKFLFSESEYIITMSLTLQDDRKRMLEMTGREEFVDKLPPHYWMLYEAKHDRIRKFQPVPLN